MTSAAASAAAPRRVPPVATIVDGRLFPLGDTENGFHASWPASGTLADGTAVTRVPGYYAQRTSTSPDRLFAPDNESLPSQNITGPGVYYQKPDASLVLITDPAQITSNPATGGGAA